MSLTDLIPSPYRWIAITLAVAAYTAFVSVGSWHVGAKLERANWQAEKLKMQQSAQKALNDRIAENDHTQKENEAKARKASEGYEQAISDLQTKYDAAVAASRAAGGLRVSRAVCGQASGKADAASTGRPDEASTGTVALPEETQRSLFDLAKDADGIAEQLRALQSWIKDSGLYGDPQKSNP